MRILLTVHQFFPNYFSGTEVLTLSVGEELRRRGHEVAVLTGFPAQRHLDDNERFDEYDHEGLRCFRFHHAYVPMGEQEVITEIEYDNHLAAQYFARILGDFKPDAVHFFHFSRLGAAMMDVAAATGIPAFYTPTDFWTVCPTSQLLLDGGRMCPGPTPFGGNCVKHVAELTRGPRVKAAARLIPTALVELATMLTTKGFLPAYPHARDVAAMSRRRPFNVARINGLNRVLSPTKLMTCTLTANGVDPALITDSAYGIETAGYGIDMPARGLGEPLVVGFIGTLAKHKGAHVLIDAFRQLAPGIATLKIYGNPADFPDYFADLENRAAGAPEITFCGTFPNGEIARVLAGIHVLVVPSLWYENAPLVVYSALAAKRPVVASDFPGLSENVVNGVNGMIFPPGDVPALAAKLRRLAEEASLLPHLSGGCRPPKSTGAYVDELEALYQAPPLARPRGDVRRFEPLVRGDDRGVLSGWAVIGWATPARISLRLAGTVRGECTRFLPRPDVRDGLARGGAPVKAHAFGYVIKAPSGLTRAGAELVFEATDGRSVTVTLAGFEAGTSRHLGGGDYIAIDSERRIWQAEGDTTS